jgi:uncharacterized protein
MMPRTRSNKVNVMICSISEHLFVKATALACLLLVASPAGEAGAAEPKQGSLDNKGVVQLETGGSTGVSVRIAEDLASIVDDGATRRVLPVVGKGSLQNITDLKLLPGVDVAILQADVLDYARQQRLYPDIENSITYIAKLYNEEFHLLARADIKSIEGLTNQTVNVDLRGSGTAVTASRLFNLLNIRIVATNDHQQVALQKLRKGEIAALALVAGKPAPFFRELESNGGVHFLAIPLDAKVIAAYVPTRINATDYPNLVSQDQAVDTVAVGNVLAVASLNPHSTRYKNVANFVDVFFTEFPSLLEPGHHSKWHEVNLAADFPGWRRFPPAEQWLKHNTSVAPQISSQDLRAIFERFIDERQQRIGGPTMTQRQKDELFGQFQRWQAGQVR